MRMNSRLVAAGVMSALFLAGGVTGGALTKVLDRSGPRWEQGRRDDARRTDRRGSRDHDGDRERSRPPEPRVMSERAARGLAYRLDLTEVQQDSVQAILAEQGRQAGMLFREMAPRLHALIDTANAAIRTVLTEDQQAAFDELLAEDRNLLGRRYGPPPAADSTRRSP